MDWRNSGWYECGFHCLMAKEGKGSRSEAFSLACEKIRFLAEKDCLFFLESKEFEDRSLSMLQSNENEEDPDDGVQRNPWKVERLSGIARSVMMKASQASSGPRMNPYGLS